MKRSILFSLLLYGLLACIFSATAQVALQWDNTFGGSGYENAHKIVSTPDGGYLIGGTSESPASGDKSEDSKGEGDYWIVKTDAAGNKEWDKTIGGNSRDELQDIIVNPEGGYLLAGNSDSDVSENNSEGTEGYSGFWIVKIDAKGDKMWDHGFVIDYTYAELSRTIPTADGGYLLAGRLFNQYSGAYWIVKVDKNGKKQWDKTFQRGSQDFLKDVVATADGGYLLLGHYEFGVDLWMIKIDAQGNKQWEKILGGNADEYAGEIITTNDGGYLVAGSSYSNIGGDKSENSRGGLDYWVVKLNAKGDKQWDKTYGGDGFDILTSVLPSADGGYVLTGSSPSEASGDKKENSRGGADYWIVRIDEQGGKIWDKTLGGSARDESSSILTTSAGSYLVAGTSFSDASGDRTEDSKGSSDFWVVKLTETVEEDFSVRSLSLVNADTDEVIAQLQQGDEINLSALGHPHLTVSANTTPVNVDSISLALTGPFSHTQTEHHYPYALFGDEPKAEGGRDYTGKQGQTGEYTLTATPYLDGRAGIPYTVSFSVIEDATASVDFFVLVNADTDRDISRLREGDVIDLEALGHPSLSIRANTDPIKVDRVELSLSGPLSHSQTEHYWPYALFGDDPDGPRDYIGRDWQPGNYTLTATPYVNNRKGSTLTISFSVTGSSSNARLAVAVYPVPTSGEITITHESTAEEAHLILLDFAGHVVLEQPLSRQAQQLDLSSFSKGFYYLKVIQQQEVQVKRIVLE